MSGIKPLDFIEFFVKQGYDFRIATMSDDEINDDWIIVNKDNFDEYRKSIEKKKERR